MQNERNISDKITTDSGDSYTLSGIELDTGSAYIGDLNVYQATADELQAIYAKSSEKQADIPGNAKEAAQIGASILDKTYENWSEAGTIRVGLNENANAWIVHGQTKDRYSTTGYGVVAIKADTGNILLLTCE